MTVTAFQLTNLLREGDATLDCVLEARERVVLPVWSVSVWLVETLRLSIVISWCVLDGVDEDVLEAVPFNEVTFPSTTELPLFGGAVVVLVDVVEAVAPVVVVEVGTVVVVVVSSEGGDGFQSPSLSKVTSLVTISSSSAILYIT